MKLKKGLVHIYTGEGKGKTTSSLGLALRAARYGLRVCFIQFMKGVTEEDTLKNVKGKCKIDYAYFGHPRPAGKWKWVYKKKVDEGKSEEDKAIAARGLEFARSVVHRGEHDVVILDEIIMALWFGLLQEEDVLSLIKEKPAGMELVLTGRRASEKLMEVADYVSNVSKIKHPYDKGILAREGIDY